MKPCSIEIRTDTDGQISMFETTGELILADDPILKYSDHGSNVTIYLSEPLRIVRDGDYTLSLTFKKKERTEGMIGLGGNSGSIDVVTENCRIERNHDAYLVYCVYQLDFGTSVQNMKLHLVAKFK